MAEERSIRLTPRQLRALSHPLRTRMLGLLRSDGPATATMLATRLGESTGATSYHLRQLAAHGFIEEDPEHVGGGGRERWWRSAHARTEIDTVGFMSDPETRGALDMFIHTVLDVHMQRLATYVSEKESWSPAWNNAVDISDAWMWLTPERALELNHELHAVLDRYRGDDPAAGGAEQVVVGVQIFPRRPRQGERDEESR